jgi:hypothetical protein
VTLRSSMRIRLALHRLLHCNTECRGWLEIYASCQLSHGVDATLDFLAPASPNIGLNTRHSRASDHYLCRLWVAKGLPSAPNAALCLLEGLLFMTYFSASDVLHISALSAKGLQIDVSFVYINEGQASWPHFLGTRPFRPNIQSNGKKSFAGYRSSLQEHIALSTRSCCSLSLLNNGGY